MSLEKKKNVSLYSNVETMSIYRINYINIRLINKKFWYTIFCLVYSPNTFFFNPYLFFFLCIRNDSTKNLMHYVKFYMKKESVNSIHRQNNQFRRCLIICELCDVFFFYRKQIEIISIYTYLFKKYLKKQKFRKFFFSRILLQKKQ